MGLFRNILVRHLFSANWNFFLKTIFSPFPSSLSSQKRISKIQNRILGHKHKEKWQRKGQVFSNWHLLKTIHQFKYLNHAEEKVIWFSPFHTNKCSNILLSLPCTSVPPSCLPIFSSYVFLSLFNFLCLFFLTHKKFLMDCLSSLIRKETNVK